MSEYISYTNLFFGFVMSGVCVAILKKLIDDHSKFSEKIGDIQSKVTQMHIDVTNLRMEMTTFKQRVDTDVYQTRAKAEMLEKATLIEKEKTDKKISDMIINYERHEGILKTITQYMKKINDKFFNA